MQTTRLKREPEPEEEVCMASRLLKSKAEFFRKKKECSNKNILLTISDDDEKYPICRACWLKIANSDLEWHSEPTNSKRRRRRRRT